MSKHAVVTPIAASVIAAPQAPELHVERPLLKLDLGCGQHPREGFEGVDLHAEQATHRLDLWKFPLPWEDDSVAEIHCSHFVEHLPAREVEERDLLPGRPSGSIRPGEDFLEAFFDECYRILVPGGTMTVVVPCARSNRGFQDPTHRRYVVEETFYYLNAGWRKLQGLDHCHGRCDFDHSGSPIFRGDLAAKHVDVQRRMFAECWNTVLDLHVVLKSRKGLPPA